MSTGSINATSDKMNVLKNVVVLGASYGGTRAAQILAQSLPEDYRIVLIDRNSHANHLYVIPRLSVLPGYEHKAFIPYDNVFKPPPSLPSPSPRSFIGTQTSQSLSQKSSLHAQTKSRHIFIQAHILSLHAHHIVIDREYYEYGFNNMEIDGGVNVRIDFEYAIYALGSDLPEPINFWNGERYRAVRTQMQLEAVAQEIQTLTQMQNQAAETEKDVMVDSSSALISSFDELSLSSNSHELSTSTEATTSHPYSSAYPSTNTSIYPPKSSSTPVSLSLSLSTSMSSSASTAPSSSTPDSSSSSLTNKPTHHDIQTQQRLEQPSSPLPTTSEFLPQAIQKYVQNHQAHIYRHDGTKKKSIEYMRQRQSQIRSAEDILIVGGGALGIQFATDIASVYPSKRLTLLHSRKRLLPRFEWGLHVEVLKSLDELQINTILGDRLESVTPLTPVTTKPSSDGVNITNLSTKQLVKTRSGRDIVVDLVLMCTGQTPNTGILKQFKSRAVIQNGDWDEYGYDDEGELMGENGSRNRERRTGLARVLRTLQIATPTPSSLSNTSQNSNTSSELPTAGYYTYTTPHPHIFIIGDAADAFGAIKAGHNSYYQGEVAARNVVRLIMNRNCHRDRRSSDDGANEGKDTGEHLEPDSELELEHYFPEAPAIKVSLGLTKSAYQISSNIGTKDESTASPDLDAIHAWRYFGMGGVTEEEMFA